MTFRPAGRDPPPSADAMSSNNKPEQVSSRPRNHHAPEPPKSSPFIDGDAAEICIVDLGKVRVRIFTVFLSYCTSHNIDNVEWSFYNTL